MVSIRQTSIKYRGRKAETYDAVRTKQIRWKAENEAVAKLLPSDTTSIVDVPVGTGRYIQLYSQRGIGHVLGIDASETMLALAKLKRRKYRGTGAVDFMTGDATKLSPYDRTFDVAVCVRFLDLIDESAMRKVVGELCRVARRHVILTIRLGDTYVPKSNTAVHDRRKFNALIRRLGWRVDQSIPIFNAGWVVLRLGRK